jgi:hypothetical protein
MKEVEELMPSKIGVNEICLFRKGSDIDLNVSSVSFMHKSWPSFYGH